MALMQDLLPQVQLDMQQPLAGTGPERWLEVGFGGGEHLAHLAGLYPDVSLIGAEAYLNGVAKLLAEIEHRGLGNVRIHYGDARQLLAALPDQSFQRLYLLYPDPWPKERQKKRRFVNADHPAYIHRVLAPEGLFHFASDIPDYVNWTGEHVQESGLFSEASNSSQPYADWITTRYEAKAIREGRTPRYLSFRKTS
jgi:tRNA (guanine-N7-)-methyltransferase